MIATAWLLGGPGTARALTKRGAERNGHVLVMDVGSRPGEVDHRDEVVSLDTPCGYEVDPVRLLSRASAAAREPDLTGAVARQVLADFALNEFALTSNVVDAFAGGGPGPLIFIYPEVHLDGDAGEGNTQFHLRATLEAVRLTEYLVTQGRGLTNAIEYPFGRIEPILDLGEMVPDERPARAEAMVRRHKISLGFALTELFGGLITTVAVDDHALWIKNQVTSLAWSIKDDVSFNRGRDYGEVLNARLKERDSGSYVGDRDLYAYFRAALDKSADQLQRANSDVCEERSRRMAELTVSATPPASVATLEVGASHVYGIRKRLRDLGISYLILSP